MLPEMQLAGLLKPMHCSHPANLLPDTGLLQLATTSDSSVFFPNHGQKRQLDVLVAGGAASWLPQWCSSSGTHLPRAVTG